MHPRTRWLCLLLLLVATVGGCAPDEEWEDVVEGIPVVSGYSALTSSDLRSANGTYGAQCSGRSGQSWSVAIAVGATLDNAPLTVRRGNSTCQLTLTGLRTASFLYTTSPGLLIGTAYNASARLFSAAGSVTFAVNATQSTADFSSNFTIDILHSTAPVVSASTNQAFYTYQSMVTSTSGLVSYWRLGDTGASYVTDDFTGTSGALLSSRSGSVGASWTKHPSYPNYAYITNSGRIRTGELPNGNGFYIYPAVYYASGVPSSADYAVQATLYMASLIEDDAAGVVARASTTTDTYYFAGYYRLSHSSDWKIIKCSNGTCSIKASANAYVYSGRSYTIKLEVSGTTSTKLRLLVDGVSKVTYTDYSSPITAAGRAGIRLSLDELETNEQSNYDGAHLDNFWSGALTTAAAADSKGTNHANFRNGVTLGELGALVGDANTAVSFDGTDDYMDATRAIQDDFSIELWFASTQGIGTSSVTQWYNTAALVDSSSKTITCCYNTTRYGFGIGLRGDGKVLAGTSNPDRTIVSTGTTTYNDDAWHHVVFTRTRATGALALYIDGVAAGTQTGASTASITNPTLLNFGRVVEDEANYFQGTLDEVAVYNTPLSAATALNHYQSGKRMR